MARQKSEFLSARGILFEIVKFLIEEVKDLGGSDEHIRRIKSDKKLRRTLAELIVESGKAALRVFRVSVNYADARWSTLEGPYTYVNSDLEPKHFPINGKGESEVTMEYVTFDHEPTTTQEVLDEIERRGNLRRPDRAEAESFIDAYPEEKDKYPIIGLCGALVGRDGRRDVACVRAHESRRRLAFGWLAYRWAQSCRFLAVRKPSTNA